MYLGQQGVATILIGAHQGLIGCADEHPRGRQLSGRRGDSAALLRGAGRSAAGDFRDEEARQQPRADAFASSASSSGRIQRRRNPARTSAASSPACRSTKAHPAPRSRCRRHERDRKDRPPGIAGCSCWRATSKDAAITQSLLAPGRHRGRDRARVSMQLAARAPARRRRHADARRRASPAAMATLQRHPRRAAGLVRFAGADPDPPRRRLGGARARRCARSATSPLLECPVRVATLLSAVRTALRARDRQYQIRGHLADRARAEESLRQRRSAEGRVPGHARPRAAQSAGAGADRPAAAEDRRAATMPRRAGRSR